MAGEKSFWVYIVTNRPHGVLYAGHTDDLARRAFEHRNRIIRGFASRYNCTRLVWREAHDTREAAFLQERRIKTWNRAWKIELIEQQNPDWADFYDTLNM